MDFLHSGNKVVNGDDLSGTVGLGAHAGVASVKSIEESDFCRRLDFVIISEFSEGEPGRPVFLAVVRESAYVLLNFLIDAFGLTVSLRVEGCGEMSLNTQEALQFHNKLKYKLRTSV